MVIESRGALDDPFRVDAAGAGQLECVRNRRSAYDPEAGGTAMAPRFRAWLE